MMEGYLQIPMRCHRGLSKRLRGLSCRGTDGCSNVTLAVPIDSDLISHAFTPDVLQSSYIGMVVYTLKAILS